MPDTIAITDVMEIAQLAASEPDKLTPAQTMRLGIYITDHEAHVLAHGRLAAMTNNAFTPPTQTDRMAARAERLARDEPQGDLTRRLAASDPAKATDTTEHTT